MATDGPTPRPHCQVCGEDLGEVPSATCEACATPHHLECWAYLGRCSTYGCGGRLAGTPSDSPAAPGGEPRARTSDPSGPLPQPPRRSGPSASATRRAALAKLVLSRLQPTHLRRLRSGLRLALLVLLLGAVDQIAGTSGCARILGTRRTVSNYGFGAVAWSGDGTLLASGEADGRIVFRDPRSLSWIRLVRAPEPHVWRLAFAPGSRRLAAIYSSASTYGSAPTGILVDDPSGTTPVLFRLPPGFQTPPVQNPSGARVVDLPRDGWYWRHLDRLAWSPDGTRLAALTQGGSVVAWDWQREVPLWVRHEVTGDFGKALAFDRTGRRVLLPGGTELDAATGEPLLRAGLSPLRTGHLPNQDFQVGPDDSLSVWSLASGWRIVRHDPSHRHFEISTPTSEPRADSRYEPRAFSADATRFAIAADDQGRIDIHELPYGSLLASLVMPRAQHPRTLAWAPDGSGLAATSWDGATLVRWDLSVPGRYTHGSPTVAGLLVLLAICIGILGSDLAAWLEGAGSDTD